MQRGAKAARKESDALQLDADRARQRQAADADEAARRVEKLGNELGAMDGRIAAEVEAVASAKDDAERAAASERLQKLQSERARLVERLEAARAIAAKSVSPRP